MGGIERIWTKVWQDLRGFGEIRKGIEEEEAEVGEEKIEEEEGRAENRQQVK